MYAHLFESRLKQNPKPGDKPRYSCKLVFKHDVKKLFQELVMPAVLTLARARLGQAEADEQIKKKKLRMPWRLDIMEQDLDPDIYFSSIQPWTFDKPALVSRYTDPDTGKAAIITDPAKIWSGCVVKASLNAYYYPKVADGIHGINLGLRNVQLWDNNPENCPRLDGRISSKATDEFDAEAPSESDLLDASGSVSVEKASEMKGSMDDILGVS